MYVPQSIKIKRIKKDFLHFRIQKRSNEYIRNKYNILKGRKRKNYE